MCLLLILPHKQLLPNMKLVHVKDSEFNTDSGDVTVHKVILFSSILEFSIISIFLAYIHMLSIGRALLSFTQRALGELRPLWFVFIHILYMILRIKSYLFMYSCRKRLQRKLMCHSSDQKECIENYGGFCGQIISKHEHVIRLKRSCLVTSYYFINCRQKVETLISLLPYTYFQRKNKWKWLNFLSNFEISWGGSQNNCTNTVSLSIW